MDLSPVALAKILLPKTPLLLKTTVLNTLSLSPNASKQDLRTELTVAVIRQLIKEIKSIGKSQKVTIRDPGIKGRMWISKVTLPELKDVEGFTPIDALEMAITELGNGSEPYTMPNMSAVEAEWTGYRGGVQENAPRPDLSEAGQYQRLMSEVKSEVTILYFHGGAYLFVASYISQNLLLEANSPITEQLNGSSLSPRPNILPGQTDIWPLSLSPLSPRAAMPIPNRDSRRTRRLPVSLIATLRRIPLRCASLHSRLCGR